MEFGLAPKVLADKILRQRLVRTPRFSSHSIGAVGLAQDAVEGQIRYLQLELETRPSIAETPTMDIWPWLVRHAGWLLETYHVKGNWKMAFEDCFGKPYQGQVMKFAEAAFFRMAVSPCGRERSDVLQGRADARFVGGIWLGKLDSDEHLFATDGGVLATRTVKRVQDAIRPETDSNDFGRFLELTSRFEFDFRRCGIFF